MKHYLLSWYGMTDLRAALGGEGTDGPLLSALATGDYSDAVILAYTDPDKSSIPPVDEVRREWDEWIAAPLASRQSLSRDETQRFVDALSNTAAGHGLFAMWLRSQLAARGVDVVIKVLPQQLTGLNDARSILSAATAAVRVAIDDPSDSRISTYVSPGTPVMAYTWALIARSNPQLDIGVVSSSDPSKPPERVELPKALLDSAIGARQSADVESREYELVIHLLGEQKIPIFFGLRQFTAERHVVVTTREYADEVHRLSMVTNVLPTPIIIADPFKPADTRRAIANLVEDLSSRARVAVNMTGGTKLMFAGALSACWELGLDPFYFEIRNHNVIFLRDGSQIPFVGISDVEDFLRANDFRTVSPGRWPAEPENIKNRRLPATQDMWRRRDALRTLYRDGSFRDFSNRYERHYPRQERDRLPFSFAWNDSSASLNEGGTTKLILKGKEIPVPKGELFPFLAGGWLEEYVYSLLRPLEEEGIIRDVRVGFEAGFRQDSAEEPEQLAQEFDCTFTDGKRLWIVECKAGPVKQEAIQKLENNRRLYGGTAARGILISSFPLTEANQRRIDGLPEIRGVNPDRLSTDMLRLVIQTA